MNKRIRKKYLNVPCQHNIDVDITDPLTYCKARSKKNDLMFCVGAFLCNSYKPRKLK